MYFRPNGFSPSVLKKNFRLEWRVSVLIFRLNVSRYNNIGRASWNKPRESTSTILIINYVDWFSFILYIYAEKTDGKHLCGGPVIKLIWFNVKHLCTAYEYPYTTIITLLCRLIEFSETRIELGSCLEIIRCHRSVLVIKHLLLVVRERTNEYCY